MLPLHRCLSRPLGIAKLPVHSGHKLLHMYLVGSPLQDSCPSDRTVGTPAIVFPWAYSLLCSRNRIGPGAGTPGAYPCHRQKGARDVRSGLVHCQKQMESGIGSSRVTMCHFLPPLHPWEAKCSFTLGTQEQPGHEDTRTETIFNNKNKDNT